jgi:hypothetical protein
MRTWKIVFAGTVLAAALIVTIVRHGSNAFEHGKGNALAGYGTDSRQPILAVTDPITPSENGRDGKPLVSEHGWGLIRTTDW